VKTIQKEKMIYGFTQIVRKREQKEEEMEKGGEEEGRSTRGPEFSSDANGSRPDEVTNRADE